MPCLAGSRGKEGVYTRHNIETMYSSSGIVFSMVCIISLLSVISVLPYSPLWAQCDSGEVVLV